MTKASVTKETAPQLPLIYQKIPAIMAELSAIGKNSVNSAQGYKYRGIEDVVNELHPLMARHQVFVVPTVLNERSEERTNRNGTVLIYRVLLIKFTFYAEDGSFVEAITLGEGMDSGDKASNKAQSVALKYAFVQVFCIQTADQAAELRDPEEDHFQVAPQKPAPAQATTAPAGYDPKLSEHKKWFLGFCSAKGYTDPYEIETLEKALTGRPARDINVVIAELQQKPPQG